MIGRTEWAAPKSHAVRIPRLDTGLQSTPIRQEGGTRTNKLCRPGGPVDQTDTDQIG